MVTINEIKNTKLKVDGDYILCELSGKSTDTKPTTIDNKKIDNGSIFVEIDTGAIYFYDLENQEWNGVE